MIRLVPGGNGSRELALMARETAEASAYAERNGTTNWSGQLLAKTYAALAEADLRPLHSGLLEIGYLVRDWAEIVDFDMYWEGRPL